jgi:hypothetical protein
MRFRPGARFVRMSLGIVVTAIGAAGCAPAPDRARHTVEEYRQNEELRRQELKVCANDPASQGSSPDCINARAAGLAMGVGSLRELPPLLLPPKR